MVSANLNHLNHLPGLPGVPRDCVRSFARSLRRNLYTDGTAVGAGLGPTWRQLKELTHPGSGSGIGSLADPEDESGQPDVPLSRTIVKGKAGWETTWPLTGQV